MTPYNLNFKAMWWIIIIKWLIISLLPPPKEEALYFDIIYKNDVIGELKAVKNGTGKTTVYQSFTHIKTRIITSVEVNYSTEVVYKDEILEEAKVNMSVNGKTYSDTHTKRQDETYQFYKNGKLKKTPQAPILYTSIQLLFEEPSGVASCYSEEAGTYFTIERKGAGTYEKINAKGKKSIYEYQNQILKSIEIDAGVVNFEMVKRS